MLELLDERVALDRLLAEPATPLDIVDRRERPNVRRLAVAITHTAMPP